jgi:EmrB/QacA subfamily drug resistance transporter
MSTTTIDDNHDRQQDHPPHGGQERWPEVERAPRRPTDLALGFIARETGDVSSERLRSPNRRRRAFALLVVAYFITIVDFTIVNVALPTIGHSLHFPESDLQWVVTAYGLTFAGFVLLGGRSADILGRRRILMTGLVIFTAASLGGGLATSDTFLIVIRGLQGLGAALVLPAALSIVMHMFPEGPERNKALGTWGGAGALGGTVGLLAGGILTTYLSWRYIFFLNVPIGAIALILAPKVIAESRASGSRRGYDPLGAVSITAALLVIVYAVSEAPQTGWATTQTAALLAVGAALLLGFLVVETRVDTPLLPLSLLRVRSVAGSNAVAFLLGTSFLTFVFLGTLFMQQVLGLSAMAAGAAWTIASVTSLTLALTGIAAKLVTRTSPHAVMAFGMTLIGVAMLWASQAPTDGSFWANLAGPFFLGGIGTAFSFIPISIGALTGVAASDAGVASGLLSTSQNLGGAIGVAAASSILVTRVHALGNRGATATVLTGGLHLALLVCGLSAIAAAPIAMGVMCRHQKSLVIGSTPVEVGLVAAAHE